MATMEIDYDNLNEQIKQKAGGIKERLIARQNELGMQHGLNKDDETRLTNIITTTREKEGIVSRIRIKFKRSGVFVHKGVGKGRPASNPKGAKEWFNPVIEQVADELADDILDGMLDVSANRLKIK